MNRNNQKTKSGSKNNCMDTSYDKKKTPKKRNITRENLNRAKKEKPLERNWNACDSSSEQCHIDQLYQGKNR